jgi:hypothetical protein
MVWETNEEGTIVEGAVARSRARIAAAKPANRVTFAPVTLRYLDATGEWWALNRRDRGWSSYGYPFRFLGDALDHFHLALTGFGRDEHGLYLTAEETTR